ncbi:MAG: GyrI-like domain-containing protein [Bacteroidales bacterium]|nr:GyrI-like domain-containing protein [Bacteroidales bacterium]
MKTKSLFKNLLPGICLSTISLFNLLNAQEVIMTDIEIINVKATKALYLKADVPIQSIGGKMGEMYGKLYGYLGQNKIEPAGYPMAVYYSFDPNGNTLFEALVPISDTITPADEIGYKEYPAMKVVSAKYTGSYDNMAIVYSKIQKYIKENKLETTGVSWEVYLTDPEEIDDPEKNETVIYFPIK